MTNPVRISAFRFWTGRPETPDHAVRLITVIGWIFCAVGVLDMLNNHVFEGGPDLLMRALTGVTIGFLGLMLVIQHSRAAALLLMIGGSLKVAFSTLVVVGLATSADGDTAGIVAFTACILTFWLISTFLAWWALRAAATIRRLNKATGEAGQV